MTSWEHQASSIRDKNTFANTTMFNIEVSTVGWEGALMLLSVFTFCPLILEGAFRSRLKHHHSANHYNVICLVQRVRETSKSFFYWLGFLFFPRHQFSQVTNRSGRRLSAGACFRIIRILSLLDWSKTLCGGMPPDSWNFTTLRVSLRIVSGIKCI